MGAFVTSATLSFNPEWAENDVTAADICQLAVKLYCNASGESERGLEGELFFNGNCWAVLVGTKHNDDEGSLPDGGAIYEVIARPGGIEVALRRFDDRFFGDEGNESIDATAKRHQELIAAELSKTEMEWQRERAKRAAAARKAKKKQTK